MKYMFGYEEELRDEIIKWKSICIGVILGCLIGGVIGAIKSYNRGYENAKQRYDTHREVQPCW